MVTDGIKNVHTTLIINVAFAHSRGKILLDAIGN